MEIDLSQFKESFFAECAEHIGHIEEGLLELEAGNAETDRLHAIFRSAHSVKGAAGTFGWTGIVRLTHAMEDLLDRMRDGRMEVSAQLVRVLLSAVDELKAMMSRRDSGDDFAENLSQQSLDVLKDLNRLLQGHAPPNPVEVAAEKAEKAEKAKAPSVTEQDREYRISFFPAPQCFDKGINPLLALRELADFGSIDACDLDVDQLPTLDQMDPLVCYLGWNLKLKTPLDESEIRTAFNLIDGDAEVIRIGGSAEDQSASQPGLQHGAPVEVEPRVAATTAASPAGRGARRANNPRDRRAESAQSIRVPAKKVDQLIDLAGELVIAYSMANEILTNFTPDCLARLREAMAAMERGTRELQERVMSVRMMPASSVFQRVPRMVYDTAAATGKQIGIQISGEDTELDKTVAEQLLDPLTHLIRNSADHGIESPQDRLRAGKPEQGLITLRAFHQSGKVVIEVADDGQGLDPERIRKKAVAKGLIAAEAQLSQSELHQLIFAPGFSTKDEVSDLSGRGVGMDVVKRNVEALNGIIKIESAVGRGTVVKLHLPLTLAIVDGLLLRVGEQSFALPFSAVVESVRPKPSQLLRVTTGVQGASNTALVLRSETMPLLPLAKLFNIPDALTDPTRGLVVIVETGSRKIALLADDIVGHQQFVIKSVEKNFRRVEGALGATILGDGKVALIIDVSALWDMNAEETGTSDGLLAA